MTQANRIPESEIKDCQTWALPDMHDGKVVPSAEREDRIRVEEEARRKNEIVGEELDIDFAGGPMTAEQLEEITESAKKEGYAEGFQQGFDEGKTKGHAEGLNRGLDEGRDQLEIQESRITELINSLTDPFQKNSKELHATLMETVCQLVKTIVQRELLIDSGQIISFVQMAIDALPAGSNEIKIYLNEDDIVLLENFKTARNAQWQLHPDPSLSAGGCRVETKQSTVDFSVEERLRVLLQQFSNGELSTEHDTSQSVSTEGEESISTDQDHSIQVAESDDLSENQTLDNSATDEKNQDDEIPD